MAETGGSYQGPNISSIYFSFLESCTLSFRPTDSSNEGPYAVQLVMEDFPRQNITLTQTNGTQTNLTTNNAISKIPVQFVIRGKISFLGCLNL